MKPDKNYKSKEYNLGYSACQTKHNKRVKEFREYYESNAYIEQLIRDGRIEIDLEKAYKIFDVASGTFMHNDGLTECILKEDYKPIIKALNQPALLKVKEAD